MWQKHIKMKVLKTKDMRKILKTHRENEILCIEKQQFKLQCIYHLKPWKLESVSGEHDLLQWCQD